jgi:hypothetical protein
MLSSIACDRCPQPARACTHPLLRIVSELFEATRPRALEDNVRPGEQFLEDLAVALITQVEGRSALARVHEVEKRLRPSACAVGSLGGFDL